MWKIYFPHSWVHHIWNSNFLGGRLTTNCHGSTHWELAFLREAVHASYFSNLCLKPEITESKLWCILPSFLLSSDWWGEGHILFVSLFQVNIEVWLLPLYISACCSTDSLTIFQKQSETAKLRFWVFIWLGLKVPDLFNNQKRTEIKTCIRALTERDLRWMILACKRCAQAN